LLDPTINRFFQSAGVAVINMKLSVGATAPDLSITTVTHQHVALSQLWHHQPIVLAFLRHFG
jgi:hypothetical protein